MTFRSEVRSTPQIVCLVSGLFVIALLTGCGGKKPPHTASIPSAPSIGEQSNDSGSSRNSKRSRSSGEANQSGRAAQPAGELDAYKNAKPIYVETGTASWYGPPYHARKTANGEVFDMNLPSAAHKTLPLNTVVRVTNLANDKSTLLRINDRGPFIGDRVLDLSLGAAKELGIWKTGLGKVKIEVLDAPKPLDTGGRWCVQIGAFTDTDEAAKLKSKLMRKYKTAKVIQFSGPTGDWVRIRPLQDDRSRAFELARDTKSSEGGVFLVRLD
jgi:rare lipoprotein A